MKTKLFIVGHARHGKTYAGDFIARHAGLKAVDSSKFAADRVVMSWMKENLGIQYDDAEECWADRHSHRDSWYKAITGYNTPDLSRLSREIFEENQIYVGIRNRDEFIASKSCADLSIWIDASERLPKEPASSMSIKREDADIVVFNNGSVKEYNQKLQNLCRIISNSC